MKALLNTKLDKRKFVKLSLVGAAAATAGIMSRDRSATDAGISLVMADEPKTIADIASKISVFSTLVMELSNSPSMLEQLASPGPYTIWAPTNQAFADANTEITNYISQGGTIDEILALHVANGIISGTPLPDNASMMPQNIIKGPIYAENGQIFVIDYVMIPEKRVLWT